MKKRFMRWVLCPALVASFLIGLVSPATVEAAPVTTSFSRPSTAYKQDGTQVAPNQPRFEPGRFGQAVMVEEGTTNLFLYSEAFGSWTLQGTPVITSDSTAAPNGAITADTVGDDDTAAYEGVRQSVSITADTSWYTVSIFIKKDTVTTRFPALNLALTNSGGANVAAAGVRIDTTTGQTYVWLGAPSNVSVQEINGYYRLSYSLQNPGTGVTVYVDFWPAHSTTLTGAPDAATTGSCVIWGAQLEKKPYLTSYMATTTTASTRADETLTIPTAGVLSAQEGTVEGWFYYDGKATPGHNRVLWASGDNGYTFGNLSDLYLGYDGNWSARSSRSGSGSQVVVANSLTTGWHYFVMRWSAAELALFFNGQKVGSVANPVLPASLPTTAYIGLWRDGTTSHWNSLIDSLRISSRARTDQEIAAAYQSGQPLSWDADTTYLQNFDPPAAPPPPTVAVVSDTALTVSWTPVADAARYNLYRGTGGPLNLVASNIADTSYTDSGLQPNTSYQYAVDACSDLTGCGPIGSASGFVSTYARTPGNVTLSATQTSMTVSWSANGNPSWTQYDVWLKPSGPWKGNGTFDVAYGVHQGDPANRFWTNLGGGWTTSAYYNSSRIEVASENGNKFIRMTQGSGSDLWAATWSSWSLRAGKWYRVTAYARTSSATPISRYGYAIYTGSFNPIISWPSLSAADGWVPAVAVFQAPADLAGGMYLYAHTGGAVPPGATIDYDNVVVEEFDAEPAATPATPPDRVAATGGLSQSFDGLTPGASFDLMVQARNGANVPTAYVSMTRRTVPATPGLPEGTFGGFAWDKAAGRGWVVAQWQPVTGTNGYRVYLWDGQAYRMAADLPASQTSWDSRTNKVFPPESAYATATNNSITGNPFCGGGNNPGYACVDLRDNPNTLYLKTAGTSTDTATSYIVKVASYNESGESSPSPVWMPTLPNRTDTTAPQVTTVRINDDQTVTGGKQVQVYVSFIDPTVANYTPDTGDDASGLVKLELSNDNTTWTTITNVSLTNGSVTIPWTLKDAFGKQYVYARVTDAAGNVSAASSDDIYYYMVDARAPIVSVTVNDGASVTSSRAVTLSITAQDDLTPPANLQMRVTGDITNGGAWTAYAVSASASLTSGDGKKNVCVDVKDGSGNTGQGCASVTLQESAGLTAPSPGANTGTTGTVTIGGQQVTATFVRAPQVALNTGGRLVEISLDGIRWAPPTYVTDFSLPDWDGIKTVYIRYAGDSAVTKVVFVLDKTPPAVQASWLGNASVTRNGSATLVLNAQDNISPQSALQVSLDGGATWQSYSATRAVTFSGSGYKTLTVLVRDQAGNVASTILGIFN